MSAFTQEHQARLRDFRQKNDKILQDVSIVSPPKPSFQSDGWNVQTIERSIAIYETEVKQAEEAHIAAVRREEEAEAARVEQQRRENELKEQALKAQLQRAAQERREAEEEERQRLIEEAEEIERLQKEEEEALREAETVHFKPMSPQRELASYRDLLLVCSVFIFLTQLGLVLICRHTLYFRKSKAISCRCSKSPN